MRPQPDFIHEFVPGISERTLLLLHGTGGNERDLLPFGRELDPNAALLSPRGKILENGMPRFFRRLAEGVFDLEDLKKRTNELADFIASAAKHYKLTADQIVAVRCKHCCGHVVAPAGNIARGYSISRDGAAGSGQSAGPFISASLDRRGGSGSNRSGIRGSAPGETFS